MTAAHTHVLYTSAGPNHATSTRCATPGCRWREPNPTQETPMTTRAHPVENITDQVTALTRDYRQLDLQKVMIEEQQAGIRTRIRDLLDVGDRVDVDGRTVSVTANRRFDPKLAEKELPTELLAMCKVEKVDAALAKRVLPPALFETFMAEVGAPVVRLV